MKTEALNSFGGGLNKDLNQLTTPAEVLTDCLNGTIVTYNGNEFSLLNDMGNAKVGTAFLRDGYVPVGMKEYGGIIYVASYNPETKKGLVGCFPSPQQIYNNENTTFEYTINLEDFYALNLLSYKNGRYNGGRLDPVVIDKSLIQEFVISEDNKEPITLYPGDRFIIKAKLSDEIIKALECGALTIKLAIVNSAGRIEYINESDLNLYTHTSSDNISTLHWILNSDNNLGLMLSEKNDRYASKIQTLKSNSSGQLLIIAELNAILNVSYDIKYFKNSDTEYGFKLTPNITSGNLDNGLWYKKIKKRIPPLENESEINYSEGPKEIQISGNFGLAINSNSEISLEVAPYTNYGILDLYYSKYTLSKLDISDPEDIIKTLTYWVLEDSIEIQINYRYINFYDINVDSQFFLYDASKSESDGLLWQSEIINNLNGLYTLSIPLGELITKNKLYVLKLNRTYNYDNSPKEKLFYEFIYATPLFNGQNIIGREPLEISGIKNFQNLYKEYSEVAFSTDSKEASNSDLNDIDCAFKGSYTNKITLEKEASLFVQEVEINGDVYDWDTYFIGNGEIKAQYSGYTSSEIGEIENKISTKSNDDTYESNIDKEIKSPSIEYYEPNSKKLLVSGLENSGPTIDDSNQSFDPTLKDPTVGDSGNKYPWEDTEEDDTEEDNTEDNVEDSKYSITITFPFIADYEIGATTQTITKGWVPFISPVNQGSLESPDYVLNNQGPLSFSYEKFPSDNGVNYLKTAVVLQHEGVPSVLVSTKESNIPFIIKDDGKYEIKRDKGNEEIPNSVTFNELETQRSFNNLMMFTSGNKTNKTFGVVVGGWGDYASLGIFNPEKYLELDLYTDRTGMVIGEKSLIGSISYEEAKIAKRDYTNNDRGYAWYSKDREIDSTDNWMLPCVQQLDQYGEPGDWICLNMGSRRKEEGKYKTADNLLILLLSLLLVYKDNISIEEKNCTKPLPGYLSYKIINEINITITYNITDPFKVDINSEWNKVNNKYLPKYSESTLTYTLTYTLEDILKYIYNYVSTVLDSAIITNNTDLNKDLIYICGHVDDLIKDIGLGFLNVDSSSYKNNLYFVTNNTSYKGINQTLLNKLFTYKDGNIYLSFNKYKNSPFSRDKLPLIFTKGLDSIPYASSMSIDIRYLCKDLRMVTGREPY